jgi:catechol 2,3-dioxygenase-like lactoylglutathione lyase family enzyme
VSGFVEIALFSGDVEATTRFYARALGVEPVSVWPGGAIFAAGSTKLLVHERSAALDGPPNEDHVAIGVGDLDRAWAELVDAGHEGLVEPRDYPWGRSAYLRDPDARLVELASS